MSAQYARISAISYHLPEKVYDNEAFFGDFPQASEQLSTWEKIGIKKRHIIAQEQTASDLAFLAAKKLFETAKIDPLSVDFLIFCAQEFDYYTPTTACVLAHRLGLGEHIGAFDYNLGCSGYVYGLSMAKGLIMAGQVRSVLLLTAGTLTKKIHSQDRSSRFLFGDGAAATLIEASDEPSEDIGHFVFGTEGKSFEKIIVRDGGARNALCPQSYVSKPDEYGNITDDAHFFMNGTAVFIFSLKTVPKTIYQIIEKAKLDISEIDLFVLHQANAFMLQSIAKKMQIPQEKMYIDFEDKGNTVSATIPIALQTAREKGLIKKGSKVIVVGFGVGLSWAGGLISF